MFLRLSSQRSARALRPCQHASRYHDTRPFRRAATLLPRSRSRHVPSSWPVTRSVSVANSRQSLSDVQFSFLRARVDAHVAEHSSAGRSVIKLGGSPIAMVPYSSERLFSNQSSRRAVDSTTDSRNMGASDISAADDGRNPSGVNGRGEIPPGMPVQDGSLDPESEEEVPVEADELQDALTRPPAVNSSYLPLPWKGRLGYVSLLYLS